MPEVRSNKPIPNSELYDLQENQEFIDRDSIPYTLTYEEKSSISHIGTKEIINRAKIRTLEDTGLYDKVETTEKKDAITGKIIVNPSTKKPLLGFIVTKKAEVTIQNACGEMIKEGNLASKYIGEMRRTINAYEYIEWKRIAMENGYVIRCAEEDMKANLLANPYPDASLAGHTVEVIITKAMTQDNAVFLLQKIISDGPGLCG